MSFVKQLNLLHSLRVAALLLLTTLTLLLGTPSAQAAEVVTYFHNDAAGTPLLATDATGNVVWKETYRPYGERIGKPAAANGTNSVWFTGKPQDEHSGLVYMGARYYEPVLGRFLGIDPAGFDEGNVHSFNRYAYGNNNPYKYVDPDGRNPLLVWAGVGAVTGGLAAGAVNAASQYLATGQIDWGVYGVGGAAVEGAQMGMLLGPAGFVAGARASGSRAEVAAAKGATPFSHLVPGGGLAAHEAAGGHLIARHVGQSETALAARLAGQPRLGAASTFASRAEAEAAISNVLNARAAEVNAWVSAGARGRLVIDGAFRGGSVLQRGAAGTVSGTGTRAVLEGTGGGGWRIITGYPTP